MVTNRVPGRGPPCEPPFPVRGDGAPAAPAGQAASGPQHRAPPVSLQGLRWAGRQRRAGCAEGRPWRRDTDAGRARGGPGRPGGRLPWVLLRPGLPVLGHLHSGRTGFSDALGHTPGWHWWPSTLGDPQAAHGASSSPGDTGARGHKARGRLVCIQSRAWPPSSCSDEGAEWGSAPQTSLPPSSSTGETGCQFFSSRKLPESSQRSLTGNRSKPGTIQDQKVRGKTEPPGPGARCREALANPGVAAGVGHLGPRRRPGGSPHVPWAPHCLGTHLRVSVWPPHSLLLTTCWARKGHQPQTRSCPGAVLGASVEAGLTVCPSPPRPAPSC